MRGATVQQVPSDVWELLAINSYSLALTDFILPWKKRQPVFLQVTKVLALQQAGGLKTKEMTLLA